MKQEDAIEAFAALAQDSRMSVFRLLVCEEPHGLPVGKISRRLNIVTSTLSGHLGVLKRAGLLVATRHQREIHYAANIAAVNRLVTFMLEDCCKGQVGHCSEILTLLDRE
jgi:ArsR family transcriptional regulator, arsenate/arsenite/antimonite-responsive transcriptional repressor